MSQPVNKPALKYQAELQDVKAHLAIRPVNWWRVYPQIVRCNQYAKELGLQVPFDKSQVKLAKDKLCQSRSNPPKATP